MRIINFSTPFGALHIIKQTDHYRVVWLDENEDVQKVETIYTMKTLVETVDKMLDRVLDDLVDQLTEDETPTAFYNDRLKKVLENWE